jgi:membrane protease YdiL (CAAX protease family)
MRATALFFLYLLACLLLAATLAPPLVQTGWVDFEPHRVLSRLAQLFMILGIWPFLRLLGLAHREALGYGIPRPELARALVRGWLAGIAILVVPVVALLALEIRLPDPGAAARHADLARKTAQALAAGLLVGVIEETFFRGALFTAIRRRGTAAAAITWSAVLYAAVHFLKPGALGSGQVLDWVTSGRVVVEAFTGAADWRNLDSFFALVLVGVFLGLVRERTRHIGWCIGLHAGWVFVIQVARYLTDGNDASPYAFLAGSYDGVIGWLAAGWLAVLSAGYAGFVLRPGARCSSSVAARHAR